MRLIYFILLLPLTVLANEYENQVPDDFTVVDEYRPPLPPPPPEPSLKVSKSSYMLTLLMDDQPVKEHRVIVGRAERETPTMKTQFSRIVINPYWEVPQSLLYKLIAIINSHRDPVAYIESKSFRVLRDGEDVDPTTIDWATLPETGPYDFSIRQDPGPDNFIGRVLFVLEDTGEVQMHDTPDKELFDKPVREFSAGCIRVENPIDLAATLIDRPKEMLDLLIQDGDQITYELSKPISVEIVD